MNRTKSIDMNVSDIVGMTMRKVIKIDDAISFESIDGRKFFLSHILDKIVAKSLQSKILQAIF